MKLNTYDPKKKQVLVGEIVDNALIMKKDKETFYEGC